MEGQGQEMRTIKDGGEPVISGNTSPSGHHTVDATSKPTGVFGRIAHALDLHLLKKPVALTFFCHLTFRDVALSTSLILLRRLGHRIRCEQETGCLVPVCLRCGCHTHPHNHWHYLRPQEAAASPLFTCTAPVSCVDGRYVLQHYCARPGKLSGFPVGGIRVYGGDKRTMTWSYCLISFPGRTTPRQSACQHFQRDRHADWTARGR